MSWLCYLLATLSVIFSIGTVAWQIPGVGLVGSLGGHLPGWLVGFGASGVVTGVIAWDQDSSIGVAIAIVASALAIVVGVKVIFDQRAALRAVGVKARPRDFFRPLFLPAAGADDVVTYGPVDGHSPRMAIYRPAASSTPAPVVVHVHGGAWMSGSETSDRAFCRYLTDRGFLVFSPTYTPAAESRPTWDLAPRQIARAIATAADLSQSHGGSAERLYLTGFSAGGHLAPLVANRLARGDTFGDHGEGVPRISAVAAHIAALDPGLAQGNPFALVGRTARDIVETFTGGSPETVPERYEATNATNFLSASSPPTLLVYGPNDWLVPSQATLSFAQRARALGVEVSAVAVPWTGHLIGLSGAGGRAIAELTVRWFETHDGAVRTEPPSSRTDDPAL